MEEKLEKLFDKLRAIYGQFKKMITILDDIMEKEGWTPKWRETEYNNTVTDEISKSLENPEKWFARHVYRTYVKEDADYLLSIFIPFAWENISAQIVFGKTDIPSKNVQWASSKLWRDNKEKFNEHGKVFKIEGKTWDDEEITGELCSIPLGKIQEKKDLKNKIVEPMLKLGS